MIMRLTANYHTRLPAGGTVASVTLRRMRVWHGNHTAAGRDAALPRRVGGGPCGDPLARALLRCVRRVAT